ncbi:MAG: reprolysin-like metallopeptidase [Agriterribacter sp.]
MRLKFYSIALVITIMFLGGQSSFGQQRFFSEVPVETKVEMRKSGSGDFLRKFSLHAVDIAGLKRYLLATPAEGKKRYENGMPLEIPLPNGSVEVFNVLESSVLSPELAAQHREIKTFSGKGRLHPGYKIRFSLTTEGFSAIILGVNEDVIVFEKVKNTTNENIYRSYFSQDAITPQKRQLNSPSRSRCNTLSDLFPASTIEPNKRKDPAISAKFSNGSSIKNYRLAIAATAEFTTAKGGQTAAYSAIIAYVNELNAIFESELSVRFTLVSGTNLVYTNAGTDPYTANDQGTMLDENQANLDGVLGNAGYDIGHVLGDGGAGSGGGVAMRPSLCVNAIKGMGASDVGDEQDYAHVFTVQLIAHEIGHQFGMSHTYNSNIPVCTTRSFGTSVEPGSGATIMSYGFTCATDDYSNDLDGDNKKIGPFLNFHVASLTQALNHMASTSCFTIISTGNTAPVIATPATNSYIIPKSTPFSLTASATDGDGEPVTYSWEGTNISDIPDDLDGDDNPVPPAALTPAILDDETHAPFFRSYSPVSSGTRTYPLISAILNGSNKARGDKLPAVAVTTTHTLTVRDNAGGVTTEDFTVAVDNAGPFLVTNDPSGVHNGGAVLNVQWSVNGTTASPINCTLVDVLLSTDGGLTFATILASAVPNSGTANVTLPNISTSQARIKIAPSTSTASGNSPNIFFDISNQDFTISSTLPVSLLTFEATLKDKNDVRLTWNTAQEINNEGFDIEISQDGQQFSKLAFIKGAGNSSSIQQYQYLVRGLANGTYFFRLKQVDIDGKFTYSKVLQVVINGILQSSLIYPNPTTNTIRIDPGQHTGKVFSIRITDLTGRTILTLPAQKYSRGFEVNTGGLTNGIYHVVFTGNDFIETHKLIKLQ